jgi:hypothetical protein
MSIVSRLGCCRLLLELHRDEDVGLVIQNGNIWVVEKE